MYTKVKKRISSHHSKSDFNVRVVYNSKFKNKDLFDPLYIKALLKRPHVVGHSYSDVAKRGNVNIVQNAVKSPISGKPNMANQCTVKMKSGTLKWFDKKVNKKSKRGTCNTGKNVFRLEINKRFKMLEKANEIEFKTQKT